MIPVLELKTQYADIQKEVEEAVCRVLARTQYVLGPEVAAFEQEFAAYHGVPHALGVASGTDALVLALKACGVGPGDEVICPPFTFMATAGAVSMVGARPVFCDVEPDTFTIDPDQLEACLTPKTRAVQVVHLYGQPCAMDEILAFARKHNLFVIEDCAQATGAEYQGQKVGTLGDAGCFSFYPSKNLGGVGDGGMFICKDAAIAEKVKCLRDHGSTRKYHHDVLGTNSRLDEIQAAVLRIKLRRLDTWNRARQAVAASYDKGLAGSPISAPPVRLECTHVYHQYTVRSHHRDALMAWLGQHEIGAIVYYPIALHLQKVYADLGYKKGDFPVTEALQDEVLSLPMYPELQAPQVQEVIQSILSFQAQPTVKVS